MKQVLPITYTPKKWIFTAATFKGLWVVSFQKKTYGILWSVWVYFRISRGKRVNKCCLYKFSLLYIDIWFDETNCKFIVKTAVFDSFCAGHKNNFCYNFVAPLTFFIERIHFSQYGCFRILKIQLRITFI